MQVQTQTPNPQPAKPLTRRQRAAAREQAITRRQASGVAITEKILQRNLFRLAKRHDGTDLGARYLALAQRVIASRGRDDGAAPFMVEMIARLERGDKTATGWLDWRLRTTKDRDLRFMLSAIFDLAGKRVERRAEALNVPVLSVRWLEGRRERNRRRNPVAAARWKHQSRPRTRTRGSHRDQSGHRRPVSAGRRSSGGRDGPSDDDGPAEPAPALRLAPKPKAILSYGCSRCAECGSVLLWCGDELVCANRVCVLYGKGAA